MSDTARDLLRFFENPIAAFTKASNDLYSSLFPKVDNKIHYVNSTENLKFIKVTLYADMSSEDISCFLAVGVSSFQ